MRLRTKLLLGGLASYVIVNQIHKESVVQQAIKRTQSIGGKILNAGATGIGNVISHTATIEGSCGCDIEPIEGMDYCDISKQMPYQDKEFDVVFAAHVIEHIQPHDIFGAITELQRIGKKVIIVVPSPYAFQFYMMSQHYSQVRKISGNRINVRNNSWVNPGTVNYDIEFDPNIIEVFQ